VPACPKPIQETKQKRGYSSLKQKTPLRPKVNQKKKEISELKTEFLSAHNRTPSRKERAEFPQKVVKELIEEAGGRCQCSCGRPDNETHHVMPRTRDGRGVKTNGMRVNSICNTRFHDNEEELQKWIAIYTEKYGQYFWYDEQDWEDYYKKQEQIKAQEQMEREFVESFKTISQMVVQITGRETSAVENRLIRKIAGNKDDLQAFATLLKDIYISSENKHVI
jgi:hypothetical protein